MYGDDGMNAINVESQPLIVTKYNIEKTEGESLSLTDIFLFDKSTSWLKLLTRGAGSKMKKNKKYQMLLDESFKKLLSHRDYLINVVFNKDPQNNINYPIHIQRIIVNFCGNSNKGHNKLSDISPHWIY